MINKKTVALVFSFLVLVVFLVFVSSTREKPSNNEVFDIATEEIVLDEGKSKLLKINNTESGLFGIDNDTGGLKYVEGNSTKSLHNNEVFKYSIDYPLVTILELFGDNKIITINQDSGEKNTLLLEQYSPIISSTVSANGGKVYFLGSFDVTSEKSILYRSDLDGSNVEEIFETLVTDIESLPGNKLILFEDYDSPDASKLSIFEVNSKITSDLSTGDIYKTSPKRTKIAVQGSRNLDIVDSASNRVSGSISIRPADKIAWLSENQLFIFSNYPEQKYVTLNVNDMSVSEPTIVEEELNYVHEITSAIDGVLYLTDIEGTVLRINVN